MKRQAYIFPELSTAVIFKAGKPFFIEQENEFKLEPLTGYKWSQLVYLNPEYSKIEYSSNDEILHVLIQEKNKYSALELAIELMDSNLSTEYRIGISSILNNLIESNETIKSFILNRFLSNSLYENLNPEIAIKLLLQNNYTKTVEIYSDLEQKTNFYSTFLTLFIFSLKPENEIFELLKSKLSYEGILAKFTLSLFNHSKKLFNEASKLCLTILDEFKIKYKETLFNDISLALSKSYGIEFLDDIQQTIRLNNPNKNIGVHVRKFEEIDKYLDKMFFEQNDEEVLSNNYRKFESITIVGTLSLVKNLIQMNNDRYNGFQKSAEDVGDSDLKDVFRRMSQQSLGFKNELEIYDSAGETHLPAGETSVSSKLHRVWIDIKSAFTGKDRHAVLAAAEYGEDTILKTYKDAIADSAALPAALLTTLQKQKKELQQSHNMIKALRDTKMN